MEISLLKRIEEGMLRKIKYNSKEKELTKDKKIEKIIGDVFWQIKANIIIEKLLELALYCNKKVMEVFFF